MSSPAAVRPRVPLKTVAIPNEHGAWGFLAEPALLGLILAPSGAGFLLVVAALGALLLQHPLSLVLADWRRGKAYPRTHLARRFVVAYGLVAAAALLAAIQVAGTMYFLLPALLAAPVAIVQLAYESKNRGRTLAAELTGAASVAALASVLLLAGGWALVPALVIWLALLARNVSSILYVRTRVRIERNRLVSRLPAVLAQLLALAVVAVAAYLGHLPLLAVAGFVVLLGRAWLGLSNYRTPLAPKFIGMRELAYGLGLVLLIVAGVQWGI